MIFAGSARIALWKVGILLLRGNLERIATRQLYIYRVTGWEICIYCTLEQTLHTGQRLRCIVTHYEIHIPL